MNLENQKNMPLNTKDLLLESAIKLFKEKGFSRVTVDEITSSIGVAKGTFYNYFSSKESILVEEFKKIDEFYDSQLYKVDKNINNEKKFFIIVNSMTYYCSNVCGVEFMSTVYSSQISNTKITPILNNKKRKLYQHIENIINDGIDSGEFIMHYSVETLTEWIIRSLRALIYDWCLYNGEFDLESEGEKYFKHIILLLKK